MFSSSLRISRWSTIKHPFFPPSWASVTLMSSVSLSLMILSYSLPKLFDSVISQRTHDAITTLLWRQNDVTTSFWRHNDVVIASCVRWDPFRWSIFLLFPFLWKLLWFLPPEISIIYWHCCGIYPDTLSCSEVPETDLKIGHPWLKSTGARSSSEFTPFAWAFSFYSLSFVHCCDFSLLIPLSLEHFPFIPFPLYILMMSPSCHPCNIDSVIVILFTW